MHRICGTQANASAQRCRENGEANAVAKASAGIDISLESRRWDLMMQDTIVHSRHSHEAGDQRDLRLLISPA